MKYFLLDGLGRDIDALVARIMMYVIKLMLASQSYGVDGQDDIAKGQNDGKGGQKSICNFRMKVSIKIFVNCKHGLMGDSPEWRSKCSL